MIELCIFTIQGTNVCDIPLIIMKTSLVVIGLFVAIVIIVFTGTYIKSRYF